MVSCPHLSPYKDITQLLTIFPILYISYPCTSSSQHWSQLVMCFGECVCLISRAPHQTIKAHIYFVSLLRSWGSEQCAWCKRCSVNKCWIFEWIFMYFAVKSLHLLISLPYFSPPLSPLPLGTIYLFPISMTFFLFVTCVHLFYRFYT